MDCGDSRHVGRIDNDRHAVGCPYAQGYVISECHKRVGIGNIPLKPLFDDRYIERMGLYRGHYADKSHYCVAFIRIIRNYKKSRRVFLPHQKHLLCAQHARSVFL